MNRMNTLIWIIMGIVIYVPFIYYFRKQIREKVIRVMLILSGVIIFTPFISFSHPGFIVPVWFFIIEKPGNHEMYLFAFGIWLFVAALIEGFSRILIRKKEPVDNIEMPNECVEPPKDSSIKGNENHSSIEEEEDVAH